MKIASQAVSRPRAKFAFRTVKTLLAAAVLLGGVAQAPVQAQSYSSMPAYVVGNDRGGYLLDRLRELRNLRNSGQPIEIRGRVCFSTCTMLIGLPQTCISPDTVFGFHGPSRNGQRLTQGEFDYYSRVMANYYPQQLKGWYMSTARNRINGVHRVKGSKLINMGVRQC